MHGNTQKALAVPDQDSELISLPQAGHERSAWALMRDQAQVLVKSGYLPSSVKSPEAAMAIMQTGREFGLQPMQSFRMIHIIEGKPTLSAQFMAALVNRHCAVHGGYLRQAELTDQRCVIEYRRAEWPAPQTFSFSMEDAKRAGLAGKGNWTKHPREMMYSRAVSNACRMGWPELVAGVYDPDELEAPAFSVRQVDTSAYGEPADLSPTQALLYHEAEEADLRDRANARYFALVQQKGLTDDERRTLQRIAYGVESSRELSRDQLLELANTIEAKSVDELREAIALQLQMEAEDAAAEPEPDPIEDDPASPVPDLLRRIETATVPQLRAITTEIREGGINDSRLGAALTKRHNELKAAPAQARTVDEIAGGPEQSELLSSADPDRFTR